MKTTPIQSFVLIAALMLPSLVKADATTHAQILKDRDSTLTQILSEQESRRASGQADEEAVFSARLALHAFRRDVAKASAEKVKQQEIIVSLCEKRLARIKSQRSAGVGGPIEVLRATDQLLEAKQILEEIHLGEKRTNR